MYFRLSFPCNPKGAYCHRVCIENYHAWQISNQSSVRTCEDDLTILRVNHASTGAKRHVPSFELPHKLVLQCDVSFQCSRFTFSVSEIDHFYHDVPSSLPCPALPCHTMPRLALARFSKMERRLHRLTGNLPGTCGALVRACFGQYCIHCERNRSARC